MAEATRARSVPEEASTCDRGLAPGSKSRQSPGKVGLELRKSGRGLGFYVWGMTDEFLESSPGEIYFDVGRNNMIIVEESNPPWKIKSMNSSQCTVGLPRDRCLTYACRLEKDIERFKTLERETLFR